MSIATYVTSYANDIKLSTEDFLGRIVLCHICGAMKVSWRSGPFLDYHILGAAKMLAS